MRGGVQMATSIGRGVNGPILTTLTAQQGQAVNAALTHKLTILTGGPGTGKTTTLRTLLDILDATQPATPRLPTGRNGNG